MDADSKLNGTQKRVVGPCQDFDQYELSNAIVDSKTLRLIYCFRFVFLFLLGKYVNVALSSSHYSQIFIEVYDIGPTFKSRWKRAEEDIFGLESE